MAKPFINFYDVVGPGLLHYVSLVVPGLECRVLDCVRSVGDIERDPSRQALGCISETSRIGPPGAWDFSRAFTEAVAVSLGAPDWMATLHTRSPFRDARGWAEAGRGDYSRGRDARRRLFLDCGGDASKMLRRHGLPVLPPPPAAAAAPVAEPPVFRFPTHARRADAHVAEGGAFEPQLFVLVNLGDPAERAMFQRALDGFQNHIVAYADEHTPGFTSFRAPGRYEVGLMFSDTPDGVAALAAFSGAIGKSRSG